MTPSRSLIENQWEIIRRFLPDDLEQSARDHGAMRRRRGQISSAEQLLRLILMHVAGGLSLEQTVTRAQARGLASLNAMALHKRLCTSYEWLEALTRLFSGRRYNRICAKTKIVGASAVGSGFWTPPRFMNRVAPAVTGAFITACGCRKCVAISLN